MAKVTLNKIKSTEQSRSRYQVGGNTVIFPNRLGWWERNDFTTDISDVSFKITNQYDKRPDLLAFDIYGKSTLMWVILQFNTIQDINEEFITDKVILLPNPNRVNSVFLT